MLLHIIEYFTLMYLLIFKQKNSTNSLLVLAPCDGLTKQQQNLRGLRRDLTLNRIITWPRPIVFTPTTPYGDVCNASIAWVCLVIGAAGGDLFMSIPSLPVGSSSSDALLPFVKWECNFPLICFHLYGKYLGGKKVGDHIVVVNF